MHIFAYKGICRLLKKYYTMYIDYAVFLPFITGIVLYEFE